MYYLNQLINTVYNFFSNDKNTLISGNGNDNGNDNDVLNKPLEDHKTVKYTTLQENMTNSKICEGKHLYGYSPFYKNGNCRFCWGLNPN